MALRIQKELLDQIRSEAEAAFPRECCGVLIGEAQEGRRTVRSVAPCANACADAPERRYRIAPAELVRTQRDARERGLAMVGFYHSHPNHSAQWSASDLEEAHWSGCSYLIVAVEAGIAGHTRSYLLRDGEAGRSFEEERIEEVEGIEQDERIKVIEGGAAAESRGTEKIRPGAPSPRLP